MKAMLSIEELRLDDDYDGERVIDNTPNHLRISLSTEYSINRLVPITPANAKEYAIETCKSAMARYFYGEILALCNTAERAFSNGDAPTGYSELEKIRSIASGGNLQVILSVNKAATDRKTPDSNS